MEDFFIDKFDYNQFCNHKTIQLVLQQPSVYTGKVKILLCHLLNAHHIWNQRILEKPAIYSVWQEFKIDKLTVLFEGVYEKTLQIIHTKKLVSEISYTNSKGTRYSNTVEAILFHIINHSTYHRGQIISELRAVGTTPITTDYIFYKR